MAQLQTSVQVEDLQKPGQIPFVMAVVEALSMKMPNMTLERVFLTEQPTDGRRNLMEHCRNHRKLARVGRQTIVDTALSERHIAARLG